MKKTKLILISMVVFLLSGCSNSKTVNTAATYGSKLTQGGTNTTEKPATTDKKGADTSNKTKDNNETKESYLGQYVIKRLLAYGAVGTYTNDDINSIIGKKLSFSKEDFESRNKVTFEKLGLKGENVIQITAADSKGKGSLFYIKDYNTLIISGGGVYVELTREK